MKTVFVINPAAGKRKNVELLVNRIKAVIKELGVKAEIHITRAVGDASRFVREFHEKNGKTRFIACGGDGTLNEVLNGVMGADECEVGVLPIGTGNDFCRNFGKELCFDSISHQIYGQSAKCDAIKYSTHINGEHKQGYCANMFNIGFDCNVADLTAAVKQKTWVRGSLAYFVSILITLIKKKCTRLKIHIDGKEAHDGRLLLTSVANGCYCGGGIKSNPLACVNDGLINVNIIKNVSRLRFISLLPYYMKGTHLKLRGIEKIILCKKCRKISIMPYDEKIRLCIDGEITDAGETEFEIIHNAFNFVVPGEKCGDCTLEQTECKC